MLPPETRTVPFIPDTAPFSDEQRSWLNGFLAGLYSQAPAPDAAAATAQSAPVSLTLLWGSQTGNAEALARKTAKAAKAQGCQVEVLDMAEYPLERLAEERCLLLITSTYGEGEPPDNAEAFYRFILSDKAPQLEGLRYSVLGLGDSNYPDFNQCAKVFDQRLQTLGASRMVAGVWCDVDFDEPYEQWLQATLDAACSGETKDQAPAKVEVASDEAPASTAPAYNRKRPFAAKLIRSVNLNGEGSAKETRHVEICLQDSGLNYEAGDALGVLPCNCPHQVDELLGLLGFSGEEEVPGRDDAMVSLREALLSHYDLQALSPELVQGYAELARLPKLASLNGEIAAYIKERHLIDLLLEWPGKLDEATAFVGLLKQLAPRLYSISSSPKAYAEAVHLTVGVVRYSLHGRARQGVCSNYLSRLQAGEPVRVYTQPNKHFRPPADLQTPMIMVGPGTGIAPFRAFLQERQATGASGKNWLFFGDQRSATDFLYADELKQWQSDGTLHRLDTAFSRDGQAKVYVQYRMREQAAELFDWLESGAHFYVCGDASRMARDVDQALQDIVREAKSCSEDQAAEYVSQLKREKRYCRDVY